jgi:hypothetical protein
LVFAIRERYSSLEKIAMENSFVEGKSQISGLLTSIGKTSRKALIFK